MSFVTEEGVTSLIEDLMIKIFQETLPHVKYPTKPFPVMSYRQAMDVVSLLQYTLIKKAGACKIDYTVHILILSYNNVLIHASSL